MSESEATSTLVHVGLRVSDLDRSLEFWRDVLGLRIDRAGECHYDLTDGHHNFRLFEHDGPDRPPHVSGMVDYIHIGVVVNDRESVFERAVETGAEVIAEGLENVTDSSETLPDGPFKIADPDGIVVDVTDDLEQWPKTDLAGKGE